MRWRYVIALSIIALMVSLSGLILMQIFAEQKQDALKINMAGMQRMLSQKIALYSEHVRSGENSSLYRSTLSQAVDTLESNHRFLLSDRDSMSAELQRLYFSVETRLDQDVRQYIVDARKVLDGQANNSTFAAFAPINIENLLLRLNSAVTQLELEASQRVERLILLERIILAVTLLVLLIEARFIFYPMEQSIKAKVLELKDSLDKISLLTEKQGELEKLANQDPLTGLHNLKAAVEVLEKKLTHSQLIHKKMALLFLDLDDFKPINDRFGHTAGDHVLVETAKRLSTLLRESDTAFRIGGDEFLVALGDVGSLEHMQQVCDRLLESLNLPHSFQGNQFQVGVSIGCAVFPDHASSFQELKKVADKAMYKAKARGKNNCVVSDAAVKA